MVKLSVYVIDSPEKADELARKIKEKQDEGKVAFAFPALLTGQIVAPSKRKPYFRAYVAIPPQIFKQFDMEKLKKRGFSIGIDALEKADIYLLVMLNKEDARTSFDEQ